MRSLELEDVANVALKKCNDEYYFFGEDGIYKKAIEKDAVKILKNVYPRKDGTIYHDWHPNYGYCISDSITVRSINRALIGFPIGATFEEFCQNFMTHR